MPPPDRARHEALPRAVRRLSPRRGREMLIGVAHAGLDCFRALLLRLGFVAYNCFIWSDRDRYCSLLR